MGGRDFPDLLQYYIGGSPQFITILHGGLFKIYYNITDLVDIWNEHIIYGKSYPAFDVDGSVKLLPLGVILSINNIFSAMIKYRHFKSTYSFVLFLLSCSILLISSFITNKGPNY